MTASDLTLFHSPNTRSSSTAILLEELGLRHRVHVLNMKTGEQRQPAFLAVNPLGKVPAVLHHGQLVTEQVAIFIYLADLAPAAGLAPALDDPMRGPYLRWLAFYAACYEPALVDQALKREPGPAAMSPYGSCEAVWQTITSAVEAGPYLLGDRFTAADVLWGTALGWGLQFGLVPRHPALVAYAERIRSRDAVRKVTERDALLAAEHEKAAQALLAG